MKKKLTDMKKWFALQLYSNQEKFANHRFHIMDTISKHNQPPKSHYVYLEEFQTFFWVDETGKKHTLTPAQLAKLPTIFELKLQLWLKPHQAAYQSDLKERRASYRIYLIGSLVAAICMTFGTTFLLGEAFATIPLLASLSVVTLPYIILPMAIIAGLAYGLLTYNAFTDMAKEEILSKRYDRLKEDIESRAWNRIPMSLLTVGLFLLTTALTLCTVGTWWTIIKQTRPLFSWMSKIPSFVVMLMGVVLAWSTWGFNVENAFTTLNELEEETEEVPEEEDDDVEVENKYQIINPARILIKLTYTPLRIILFLAHLLSVSVTGDRVPNLPEIVSIILGFISEGFEDWHYIFSKKNHGHKHDLKSRLAEQFEPDGGHDHDNDIPTQVLKGLFYPLFLLAAKWHFETSKIGREDGSPAVSFKRALEKQQGIKKEKSIPLDQAGPSPSHEWEKQHMLYLIEKEQKKLSTFAVKKHAELEKLREVIYPLDFAKEGKKLDNILHQEATKEIYNTNSHTPTFFPNNQTSTASFIRELPLRTRGHAPVKKEVSPMPTDLATAPAKKKSNSIFKDCFAINCSSCPPAKEKTQLDSFNTALMSSLSTL